MTHREHRLNRRGRNAPSVPATPTEVVDLSTWPKDELKDLCRARDLPVSGSKAELVARLEE